MNIIDIIALLPIAYFVLNGYKSGILKQAFGLIGIILGVIITLQFSNYIVQKVANAQSVSSPFLPVFIYAILFVAIFLLAVLVGRLLEKLLKAGQLNIGNRIAGAVLGLVKAFIFISLFVWIADLANFFDQVVKNESLAYNYARRFTPVMIEIIGELIPTLKELIANIEDYFAQIAKNLDSTH